MRPVRRIARPDIENTSSAGIADVVADPIGEKLDEPDLRLVVDRLEGG